MTLRASISELIGAFALIFIGAGAAGEYSGTSSVSVGQARPWPTMTPMV